MGGSRGIPAFCRGVVFVNEAPHAGRRRFRAASVPPLDGSVSALHCMIGGRTSMKRFLVRLFALGILVAAGVIAFAQSQRGSAATPKAGEDPQFDPFQGAESHLVGPADPFAGAPPVKERN